MSEITDDPGIPFGQRMYTVTLRVLVQEDGPCDAIVAVTDTLNNGYFLDVAVDRVEGPERLDFTARLARAEGKVGIVSEEVRTHEPYAGEIKVGDEFMWEPDLPHAREPIVVTKIDETQNGRIIWSQSTRPSATPTWNEESRFREAVVPR